MIIFAQLPRGFSASLLLKPQGLFISFARTKETKQRRVVEDYVRKKSPSALFCLLRYFSTLNKKNSLSLKQLFVFNAPKSTSAPGKKVRPEAYVLKKHCFARWEWVFFLLRFFHIQNNINTLRIHQHQRAKQCVSL